MERMLFQEIDNMVWSGVEKEVTEWCKRNKVYRLQPNASAEPKHSAENRKTPKHSAVSG